MLRHASVFILAMLFLAGGINHFLDPAFYLRMMPDFLPAHGPLVMLSGITEVAAGAMLLVPATRAWGARFISLHLVVFLLVHGWMLAVPERFPGIPVAALWARLLVQFVLMAWALVHADVRRPAARAAV